MKKSVVDMIFDKFENKISNDGLFTEISDELIDAVTQDKIVKSKIEQLLRKQHDEN